MPGPETRPLFDVAVELGVGFYLDYAELTQEKGEPCHYRTSILAASDGRISGRYRKIHLPGHSEHLPDAPFQHLEKRYFDVLTSISTWRLSGNRRSGNPAERVRHPEPNPNRLAALRRSCLRPAWNPIAGVLESASFLRAIRRLGHCMVGLWDGGRRIWPARSAEIALALNG